MLLHLAERLHIVSQPFFELHGSFFCHGGVYKKYTSILPIGKLHGSIASINYSVETITWYACSSNTVLRGPLLCDLSRLSSRNPLPGCLFRPGGYQVACQEIEREESHFDFDSMTTRCG